MARRDDDACLPQVDVRTRAAQIAALNDALRRDGISGRLAVTAGVITLGGPTLLLILAKVATYDRFDDDDLYGEHDFGVVEHAGTRLFWKIDYYNREMTGGSPHPADPAITARVLTLMLAEEY